jgi:type I restriction enzyme M protein
LIVALESVWKNIDHDEKRLGWTDRVLENKKKEVAARFFFGLDKDNFLAKVTKAYMALVGDGRGGIFCENSLKRPTSWATLTSHNIMLNKFDLIVTNPNLVQKFR